LNTYPVEVMNDAFVFPDVTVKGQVYLVFSKNGTVSDDQIIAGPAIIMAV
jgi:hypothetical protein